MNVRRLLLDVDKAVSGPDLITLAQAIAGVPGVEGANITVTEIDIETVGMDITIEGNNLDHAALIAAIEDSGAVVHSVDQVVIGERIVERIKRER